jgi:hypothetical protein
MAEPSLSKKATDFSRSFAAYTFIHAASAAKRASDAFPLSCPNDPLMLIAEKSSTATSRIRGLTFVSYSRHVFGLCESSLTDLVSKPFYAVFVQLAQTGLTFLLPAISMQLGAAETNPRRPVEFAHTQNRLFSQRFEFLALRPYDRNNIGIVCRRD